MNEHRTIKDFDRWIKNKKPKYEICKNGFPDRVLIYKNKFLFVEVKAINDKIKTHQEVTLKIMEKAGMNVYVAKEMWKNEFELIPLNKIDFKNFESISYLNRLRKKAIKKLTGEKEIKNCLKFNQKSYYKTWRARNLKKIKNYMRSYRHKNPKYVKEQREKARKPDGYIARRGK